MTDERDRIGRERIARALDYVAILVARHGEAYLPVFRRLEKESAALAAADGALAHGRAMAAQIAIR
jgi:hypothetical protein